MSIKNTKNLLIIGSVLVALLAGTVLLGNYTNLLSANSETSPQVKASDNCPAAKTCSAEKAECGSAAKTCPLDSTKPCCAVEASNECPAGCTKPCCAEETKAGCCPKSDASTAKTGCCPVASTTN